MDQSRINHEKLRGVNLGGWLVLERWLTPSLFRGTDAADEYAFMQTPGAREKLERHRKTFITEKDFKWMATSGLNAVRIPVPYWLLDGDGPYVAGIEHLDRAVEMAGRCGLKILLDLHGASGSQNGHDHSGRIGKATWFHDATHRVETVRVLTALARRYRDAPNVWGIEMLNEPKINLLTFFKLRSFYKHAYRHIQTVIIPGTYVAFSDAFMPRLFSGLLKEAAGYPVAMDVHWYQFGKTNLEEYFVALRRRPEDIKRLQRKQPVVIGEWSGMLSHETLEGLPEKEKLDFQKQHIAAQIAAYDSAAGWFYWTYKTEEKGIWNFRWLVETGQLQLDR